ncbi:hypothetical protein SYNPS1DRAFT_29799 [Syncephalis pseudoplumigaleata]|uniref:Uncharacterized protein n=1 Tax=Syncephalis pseudoplumigaleata TaxID=1712513 RepID=A0A4P9YYK8_9FUNG|nr:hypothetical protein SYNPS1DRAFT_29799 [Syncephalis pseudoplumigaleata]|eukprot:RKP24441.1 hypothetical protein SYNPS1DRAFT_29799 [Syncephalis pseudoplumigaleata]
MMLFTQVKLTLTALLASVLACQLNTVDAMPGFKINTEDYAFIAEHMGHIQPTHIITSLDTGVLMAEGIIGRGSNAHHVHLTCGYTKKARPLLAFYEHLARWEKSPTINADILRSVAFPLDKMSEDEPRCFTTSAGSHKRVAAYARSPSKYNAFIASANQEIRINEDLDGEHVFLPVTSLRIMRGPPRSS